MTIKEIIQKAIDGGWLPQDYDVMVKYPIKSSIIDNRIELQAKSEGGGWSGFKSSILIDTFIKENIYKIILDQDFWKAVGKVEGWGNPPEFRCAIQTDVYWYPMKEDIRMPEKVEIENKRNRIKYRIEKSAQQAEDENWVFYMHEMIDALCEGKSIKEYIATL